jgi:flagellin
MSTRINHNILALTAQRNIYAHQADLDTAVARLSSGLRINNSWDDPAGLAVSERFRAQIASMQEAERNAHTNVNLISTAEGALSTMDEMLIRMRALAVEASNGALQGEDRVALDVEFQQLKSEVDRIARITNFAGTHLLDGSYSASGIKFHIGINNIRNEDYYFVSFTNMTAGGLGLNGSELTSTSLAQAAIDQLDAAINSKDVERTRLGAYAERLQNTIKNLQLATENATASESQIRDADIALEMSNFVRAQIMMQSGVAMLSQANMVPQIIAGLVG